MSAAPILEAEQHWECPSCVFTVVDHAPPTMPRLHRCKGQALLLVPMIPAGTRAVHVVHELEDYAAGKLIRCDATGRPVTHVNVVRDDGMDAVAYPIAAVITREEIEEARSA